MTKRRSIQPSLFESRPVIVVAPPAVDVSVVALPIVVALLVSVCDAVVPLCVVAPVALVSVFCVLAVLPVD